MMADTQKSRCIRCVVFIMAVLLCLTGCESAAERKKRLEKESRWQEQAMKNAERYILEKYGVQAEAVTVETIYESPGLSVGPDRVGKMYETLSPRFRISIAGEYQDTINGIDVDVYYPRETLKDIEKPVYDMPDVLLFENEDEGFRKISMLSEHDGLFFFSLDTDDDKIEFAFATMLN